jgi:predicted PurR-regulated permease PerM
VTWFEQVSPLRDGQTTELLSEFRKVSVSVLTSSLATALVQTAVALPGYLIAGVPRPWLFTVATFFMSFIPTIGAGGTCMAAAALLLILGRPWMALLIALWGAVLVGLSDNLVKPLLVRRGIHMHGGVVFVALVSGLAAFGPIGLLLGPLIVSFLLALIRIYRRDYRPP